MKNSFADTDSEEKDFAVPLLSSRDTSPPGDEYNIYDLLTRVALDKNPVRAILSIENNAFALYALRVNESVSFTVKNAIGVFNDFIYSDDGVSTSIFYKMKTGFRDQEQGINEVTCLATLSRTHGPFFDSSFWSNAPTLKADLAIRKHSRTDKIDGLWISSVGKTWKKYFSPRPVFWSMLAAILVAILVVTAVASRGDFHPPFHQYFENGIWIRYDIKGSQGPRHQLQFSRHNVSDWAAQNPHQNGEWAVRIDDQAMIPARLMDEDELRYQRWFQKRYPDMKAVVDNQDYLNRTFLSDPDRLRVPADWMFHHAHCMLAVRRYWKAKETGKHVCPRDIDHRHLKHCLDSMDKLFFIDGEMRTEPEPVDYLAPWFLIWKTKVCW